MYIYIFTVKLCICEPITCSGTLSCYRDTIECTDTQSDCIINCMGTTACLEATFLCSNGNQCYIYCDNYQSCFGSHIFANYSKSLHVVTDGLKSEEQQLEDSSIYCPYNGSCDIQCIPAYSCRNVYIYAQYSLNLNLACISSDIAEIPAQCHDITVYCPLGSQSSLDHSCIINASPDSSSLV